MKQLAFLMLFSLCGVSLFALRFEGDKNVLINEDIHEDIYVAGGEVRINGKVFGDVFAMGGEVLLEDSITGDVFAGGGKVFINGAVGDDVRVAGGEVSVRMDVAGDVIVTGGEIQIDRTVRIGGDLIAASGDIQMDGNVMGDARIAAGDFNLDGTINGAATIRGGDFTINGQINGPSELAVNTLNLRSDARFGAAVSYWTEEGEVDFGEALAGGVTATYDSALKQKRKSKGISVEEKKPFWKRGILSMLWYFLSMGLLAALLQYLFGEKFRQAAALGEQQSFEMLLRGFAFFVVTPFLAIMLLVTIIGLPIGLLLGGLYILIVSVAKVVTASIGAQWLRERQGAAWTIPVLAGVSLVILALLKAVSAIPLLGWLLSFVATCVAYGALYTLFQQRKQGAA